MKAFPYRLSAVVLWMTLGLCATAVADPLPSWNDGENKQRIIAFVESVTDPSLDSYVPPEDRIATFDNDGTLWAEQPFYFQYLYAMDRFGAMAKADPSIADNDTKKAAAAGDLAGSLARGLDGAAEIIMATHSGMSVDAFGDDVRAWLDSARHQRTGLRYDQMTYQPMLELIRYLRDEEFGVYIVSGGGIHFMRAFAEAAYGIPAEQVIGSAGKSHYEVIDSTPTIMKDEGIFFVDDKEEKPIGIDSKIGRRPILAAGNSDGDFQMLEWTTAGDGPRLGLYVHHTDAEREWAYDREGHVGHLDRGLDEAQERGWMVVDMAKDWDRIWSAQP